MDPEKGATTAVASACHSRCGVRRYSERPLNPSFLRKRRPALMKPKVFVTRPLPPPVLDRLAARCDLEHHPQDTPLSTAQLAEACREMEGVMVCGARLDEEVLRNAPRLRVVSNVGVGYDNIDVAGCTRRRIPVTNTAGVLEETTADL